MPFNTEPTTAYSGSYLDVVCTGSLVQYVSGVLVHGDRGKVGSTIFGDDYEFTTKNSLHDLADGYYNKNIIKAGFKRSIDLVCINERFYDSLVPDFRTITSINGAQFVAPNWYNLQYPLLKQNTTDGTLKLIISVGYGGAKGHVISEGTSSVTISDDYWWDTCPFENRYASASRIPNLNSTFVTNRYVEHRSPDNNVSTANGVLSWSLSDSDISGGYLSGEVTSSNKFLVSYAYGNNSSGTDKLTLINLFDYRVAVTARNPVNYTQTFAKHLEDNWFTRFYFGYFKQVENYASYPNAPAGNVYAPNDFPETYSGSTQPFPGRVIPFFSFAPPRPNGWKYGLLNGFTQYSKAIYRLDHHGFLRDMLEQRQYSKFYHESVGSVTDSVIQVVFVSGSQDYATASNQMLNMQGSGIYDFECRASRPYHDDQQV